MITATAPHRTRVHANLPARARATTPRATPLRATSDDPETQEILNDPEAMAAINAHRAGKITRWYTTEEVFGE